jgi:hypothetical protein
MDYSTSQRLYRLHVRALGISLICTHLLMLRYNVLVNVESMIR